MSNLILKYENFFPEKVYYCAGMEKAVNEIFNKQICSYTEMVLAILECCVGDGRVFCTRANKKKKIVCFFVSLMIEGKFA